MRCNSKCCTLLLSTATIFLLTILPQNLVFSTYSTYSNSTTLLPVPDDTFHGMPVFFKSNVMIKSLKTKEKMHEHIQRILQPLTQYIMSDDVKVYRPKRYADSGYPDRGFPERGGADLGGSIDGGGAGGGFGGNFANGPESVVQVEQYDLPFIAAAQIGAYTFTCRQSNGDLVIYNPTLSGNNVLRSIPSFTELQLHPRPGIWWWVQCVTFETGGAGMGITGVQKPGGDAGIDPNALKSLVG